MVYHACAHLHHDDGGYGHGDDCDHDHHHAHESGLLSNLPRWQHSLFCINKNE